jgi:hypothetical protein
MTDNINDTAKPWYESMTIRNSILSMIAMAATLATAIGWDFDTEVVKDSVNNIFIGISGVVALYANIRAIIGRIRAKTNISPIGSKPVKEGV